ncbi:MAG: MFS transporter [Candidatus Peribacteraceae bacterium]|jgi:MFS family permease
MADLPTTKEVNRTVRTFAWASFLHDVGSDMIFSVWPLFLTQVLGANRTAVGLIDGISDALVSISQAVSGYISDRIRKRKIFVWTGYLFGAVARLGYAIAPSWGWVIPFRILDRTGKMRGAPRDAIVSDISTRENRASHFGLMRAMDNAGAVAGVLLAMVLLRYVGLRTMFIIAAIPSLFASLLVILVIRERRLEGVKIFRGIRFSDIGRDLKIYMILSGIFQLGSFSYSFLLLAAGTLGFQMTSVPALYLLYSLVAAIVSLPVGRLADRVGRKPLLFASFAMWICVLGLFLLQPSPSLVVLAFVLYGLHLGMLDPVQKTFVAELAPKDYVASALGGYQLAIGLVSLPASLFAGILWDRTGFAAPFLFSLGLTALAAVLLVFVREKRTI